MSQRALLFSACCFAFASLMFLCGNPSIRNGILAGVQMLLAGLVTVAITLQGTRSDESL